ncbi:MAG: methyl-accepting chemotaxis protein [Cyanobacteria bacterium J06650_10]
MPSENNNSAQSANGLNPENTTTNRRSTTQLSNGQRKDQSAHYAAHHSSHHADQQAGFELTPPDALSDQDNSSAPEAETDSLAITQPKKNPTGLWSWWTLKNKATLLAVALGTIPVLIIGGISTSIAGKQLSKEVIEQQQQFTNAIALQLQDFGARQQESLDPDNIDGEEIPSDSLSERILNYTEVNNLSALVNERVANLRQGTSGENNTLRFNVVDERRNRVLISNEQADINTDINAVFSEYASVRDSETAAIFKAVSTQDNQPYLVTYTPVQNIEDLNNDLGVLVYQPISEVFAPQQSLVLTLLAGTVITALLVSILAAYLANRATQPIIEASMAVEKLGQGKFDTRLKVKGEDELAVLNSNINVMAEQLEYQLEFIQDTAKRQNLFQVQATLVEQNQKQREALQRGLSQLIASVSGTEKGDLTGRAAIADGDLGKLGNLFDTATDNLRDIVIQAKRTTVQIETALTSNQSAMQRLAKETQSQSQEISQFLPDIENLSTSVEVIRTTAQQGERLSYDTTKTAHKSEQAMEQSAHSLSGLSHAMTEANSKVKQMGVASQQVHQVISLLNEIALKINLLAINASIEKRQGSEEAQDFSIVAGEIGQLTEQSTRTTREIERIVKGIQDDIKEVASTLELCTAQATDGTAELGAANANVAQMLSTSQEMDELLHNITEATAAPALTAKSVLTLMQQMATVSQRASAIPGQAEVTLKKAVESTQVLSAKASQFRVDS